MSSICTTWSASRSARSACCGRSMPCSTHTAAAPECRMRPTVPTPSPASRRATDRSSTTSSPAGSVRFRKWTRACVPSPRPASPTWDAAPAGRASRSRRHIRDAIVDAIDIDAESVEAARSNVAAAGLSERVHPRTHDASESDLGGRYDLITVFEALHDMNHPVDALRSVRASLTDGGWRRDRRRTRRGSLHGSGR